MENNQTLQKYHSLIDSIDGIVWECDANIQFTFVSKQAERLLGYPVEEWLNDPHFWVNHLHPEDRDDTVAFCKAQCDLMQHHDFEYRIIAKDGSVKWLRDIVSIISINNQFAGLRGVMVDITEMKKTQEERDRTMSMLSATLESTADGIVVIDLNRNVLRYNQQFVNLWKIPEHVLKSSSVLEFVNSMKEELVNPEAFIELVNECINAPEAVKHDFLEFHDGKIFERYSKPQVINNKIVGRVSSFRDVTAQVQLARQKERLLEEETKARYEAEKSIKLRDDFLSIASHELKTPLTPIRMQLRLLKRLLVNVCSPGGADSFNDNTSKMDKILEDADRQFSRFLKLVEDLLDVSRITADRLILIKEEVNLSELIEENVAFLELDFKKEGCEVSTDLEKDIIGHWDRTRLEQVLTNLLSNARKYGAGRPIEISLKRKRNKSGKERAALVVRDHGIGISKEDQEKIFGRFERFAPVVNYGGLGLGLFISHNIVKAHGGAICLESELGKGTSFIVDLPLE